MSKSEIVFQLNFKCPKNKKIGISKWINYATQKQKADSVSIDEYNVLKDFVLYSDKDSFLTENDETYLWNNKGDILKKEALAKLKDMNYSGVYWRGFLSFPNDFAINHGLITKMDYYSLTNNVMPSLLLNMGLDLNNVEWMCVLHRDTSHPHVHLCIYEKNPTKSSPYFPKSTIYKFKSNVANYLIDNEKFYKLRDKTFINITDTINIKELNKVKSQRLYSDKYRKELNEMLLNLYDKLPSIGRLQYNSKNIKLYKNDLDCIIEHILLHDSVKYDYSNYLRLLEKHQKELNQIYGNSKLIDERKYYDEQVNRLYSKIGNEILQNFKRYQALDFMEREKKFLQKHINELDFKSRKDYVKEETKINIARDLYKICVLAGLNDIQMKKVFERWNKKSGYNFEITSLITYVSSLDNELSISEYYSALKKLGYDSNRYNKFKTKNFYREVDYKNFINKAVNHLLYELEHEEKLIVEELQYVLDIE